MQSHRFIAEIWSPDSPKIQIASVSWRSIMEQERLDRAYSEFVTELHRRIAAAGGEVQFSSGVPAAIYWLGVVVFAAVMIAIVIMAGRSALAMQWTSAAIVAAFLAVFVWQIGGYFLRNRPGRYRPDAIPPGIMPKAPKLVGRGL
jgi:branched-subunit amino acid transport protein